MLSVAQRLLPWQQVVGEAAAPPRPTGKTQRALLWQEYDAQSSRETSVREMVNDTVTEAGRLQRSVVKRHM